MAFAGVTSAAGSNSSKNLRSASVRARRRAATSKLGILARIFAMSAIVISGPNLAVSCSTVTPSSSFLEKCLCGTLAHKSVPDIKDSLFSPPLSLINCITAYSGSPRNSANALTNSSS